MADRPKRPLSAYMLWLNENREQIKRENPGIKVTEIAKRGGELWRGLKDKSVSTQHFIKFLLQHFTNKTTSFGCFIFHTKSKQNTRACTCILCKSKPRYKLGFLVCLLV